MDFNNHKTDGFTLIEVMVATLLIGLTLVGLLMTQQLIMTRVSKQHQVLERIPIVKDLFANPLNAEFILNHESINRTIENPETILSLNMIKSSSREQLKNYEHIFILPATAQWTNALGQEKQLIIGTLFSLPEPEDEKKK